MLSLRVWLPFPPHRRVPLHTRFPIRFCTHIRGTSVDALRRRFGRRRRLIAREPPRDVGSELADGPAAVDSQYALKLRLQPLCAATVVPDPRASARLVILIARASSHSREHGRAGLSRQGLRSHGKDTGGGGGSTRDRERRTDLRAGLEPLEQLQISRSGDRKSEPPVHVVHAPACEVDPPAPRGRQQSLVALLDHHEPR
jgi:hypothetical protein